jgi:hypothetical protein
MGSRLINCVTCGESFLWTDDQDRNFKANGLETPTHCEKHRSERRYARQPGAKGLVGETRTPSLGDDRIWNDALHSALASMPQPAPAKPEPATVVPQADQRQGCLSLLKQLFRALRPGR